MVDAPSLQPDLFAEALPAMADPRHRTGGAAERLAKAKRAWRDNAEAAIDQMGAALADASSELEDAIAELRLVRDHVADDDSAAALDLALEALDDEATAIMRKLRRALDTLRVDI